MSRAKRVAHRKAAAARRVCPYCGRAGRECWIMPCLELQVLLAKIEPGKPGSAAAVNRWHVTTDALPKQCEHANAQGQYVIRTLPGVRTAGADRWHAFDPPTKMQALFWSDNVESRRKRIHWLCGKCGQVMPLGSYES